VPVQGHRRIEAPHNRFSRSTFRLKLGHKAARGLGLGGSAAAIYSHSQERRDLLVLGHAADFRWGAARSIRSNGSASTRTLGNSNSDCAADNHGEFSPASRRGDPR